MSFGFSSGVFTGSPSSTRPLGLMQQAKQRMREWEMPVKF